MGGLVCAAYLATNGIRPLVLEQYDTIGGSTHVFRRRRRWEFDVGVHYLGDCGPGGNIPTVLHGLGLAGRIRFRPMDRDGFSTVHVREGSGTVSFRVPAGWDRYLERLIETFPDQERGIRRCVGILRRVAAQVEPFDAPVGVRALARFPFRAPLAMYWGMRPLAQLFDACGLSATLRTVLGGEVGVYAAPPSRVPVGLHAAMLQHYVSDGAYYPEGGGQVIAAHLLDVIRGHGGDVRTHAKVDRILVERRRAVGVELADGERIMTPTVVSNADVKRTYLELLPREAVPWPVRLRARSYRMAIPIFCVYLGLDIDLTELMPNTNIWYHPTNDHEALFAKAYRGTPDDAAFDDPPLYLTSATLKDPTNTHAAPPGHSCLQLMTLVPPQYAFWGVASGPGSGTKYRKLAEYRAIKERITESLVAQAIRLLPGIAGHIVWQEGATPLTQERYTLTSDGACYGLELAWDQFGLLRPGPTTRVRGLYLTGASTRFCHGIMASMVGGVGTAGCVLGRDLRREIRDGRVFGDPARLTAGGPGWDPLADSRGLALRPPPRRAVREAGLRPAGTR
jgi:phytoene dehydrogenase-like protein